MVIDRNFCSVSGACSIVLNLSGGFGGQLTRHTLEGFLHRAMIGKRWMKELLLMVKDIPSFWLSEALIRHDECSSTVDPRWVSNSNRKLSQGCSDERSSSSLESRGNSHPIIVSRTIPLPIQELGSVKTRKWSCDPRDTQEWNRSPAMRYSRRKLVGPNTKGV
ncbi:hypothetical protein B0T20DRAFT_274937 [Sordaria brevicollis]|uniref:Uncharacterized protein n=1 Tax=Sordaria brevicollis TaxID=83679 RepID=A0AAE0PAY7_SORBR|nr:hypothetical protein B0T20DRAFT_274937 [Sordaria brevicollis]